MTATVPPIIGDLTALCAFVVAVGAATALLWRTPPVRWFLEQLAESFGGWMQVQVQEANKDHVEYVRYHLGPNGTTKPVHQRLCDLERAAGTDDAPSPMADWNGPYSDDDAV